MDGPNMALFEAVKAGQEEEMLAAVAAGADPNFTHDAGFRPLLMDAVEYGQLRAARLLLKMQAVLSRDNSGGPQEGWITAVTVLLMAGAVRNLKISWDGLLELLEGNGDTPESLATLLEIPLPLVNGILYPTEQTYSDLKHSLLLDDDDAVRDYSLDLLVKIIIISALPDPGENVSAKAKRRMAMSTANLSKECRRKELAKRRKAKGRKK
jgi:ankyrin repeat protein